MKRIAILLALLVGGATLAFASGDVERAAEGPVSLTVWMGSWWDGAPAQKVVAAFEKEHPNRKLKIEVFPINGYQEKMVTSILGGSAADIIALDATMIGDVAGRNLLETWDDHIKGLDVEDFDKGIWSASVVNGKLYAMPHRGATGVYFYNKTMFDEVGLAYPKEGWTYQDMLAMAKKITVPGQKYGVGIAASASDVANVYTSFAPVVWANKGEFLSADNKKARINEPEGVAGITFWTELYTKHKVVPEGSINFAITKDVVPLFMNNKVAMFPGSSAQFTMLAANPAVKWAPEVGPDGWNRGGGWALTHARHQQEQGGGPRVRVLVRRAAQPVGADDPAARPHLRDDGAAVERPRVQADLPRRQVGAPAARHPRMGRDVERDHHGAAEDPAGLQDPQAGRRRHGAADERHRRKEVAASPADAATARRPPASARGAA